MKILLVHPAAFEENRVGLENTVWMSEPVALTSIAAMVIDTHEVRILDQRAEPSEALPKLLRSWRPDLVGTTAMTTDAYQALAVLRNAREILPGVLTLVGGHHPTLMPEIFREPYVDAMVKGEGELVFQEIVRRWGAQLYRESERDLACLRGVGGTEVNLDEGWIDQGKSPWVPDLDTLPAPSRHLIKKYKGKYFFSLAKPMASVFTSRGCSFDCNFCAIWEFYERRTRFLSASVIADRMADCEEDFVFLLDDNFLTRTDRLWALADELERRGIKKYWMSQGRSDFVAKNPELMKRLAEVGMIGLLSGYESNSQDSLDSLRKRGNLEANMEAARILRDNGIISTGIFMVRPEFTEADFRGLYDYIRQLGLAMPLVSIQTPLPGTELFRDRRDELLTEDFRLFDLNHCVLPTLLPREEFYRQLVGWEAVLDESIRSWFTPARLWRRRDFYKRLIPVVPSFVKKRIAYRRIHFNPSSYLRDEVGIIREEARMEVAAK